MDIYWIYNSFWHWNTLHFSESAPVRPPVQTALSWSCWDTPGAFWSSRLLSAAQDSAITSTCDSHQKPREQPFSDWISLRAEAEAGMGIWALHKEDLGTEWTSLFSYRVESNCTHLRNCCFYSASYCDTNLYKPTFTKSKTLTRKERWLMKSRWKLPLGLSFSFSLSHSHTHFSVCFYLSFMWSINTCWYKATAFCGSWGELLHVTQSRT